jgi:GNAT superfamily N-acetyltransferase
MLSVETLQDEDLPTTAALHEAHLRLGLFPKLGPGFLQAYHESFARSPHGIALVARSGYRVVGTLFGTSASGLHQRWVLRNFGARLAWRGTLALLSRPEAAWLFATTRLGRYITGLRRHLVPLGQPAVAGNKSRQPVCVLSHIVTCKEERGRGIGRRMVERFKVLARADGARHARIITQATGLGAPFFERIGCQRVGDGQMRDGNRILEYQLLLDETPVDENVRLHARPRVVVRNYRPGFRAGGPRRAGVRTHAR